MKVIVDTNVLVSGIFWRGVPRQVLTLWLEGHDDLLVSIPILNEYQRILKKMCKDNDLLFSTWMRYLTGLSIVVEPIKTKLKCRDPHDVKFLEAALGGKAAYIISGDQDLASLKTVEQIPIVSPRAYLDARR